MARGCSRFKLALLGPGSRRRAQCRTRELASGRHVAGARGSVGSAQFACPLLEQVRSFLAGIEHASFLTAASSGASPRLVLLRYHAACELSGTATCALGFRAWDRGLRVTGSSRMLCVGVIRG